MDQEHSHESSQKEIRKKRGRPKKEENIQKDQPKQFQPQISQMSRPSKPNSQSQSSINNSQCNKRQEQEALIEEILIKKRNQQKEMMRVQQNKLEDGYGLETGFRIKRESRRSQLEEQHLESEEETIKQGDPEKVIRLELPVIDIYRALNEIVQYLQGNEEQLGIVTNLICLSNQEQRERRAVIEKKKKQLMGSNLTADEYQRVQKDIDVQEISDTQEIKMKIFQQLQNMNIRHFENLEQVKNNAIQKYKKTQNINIHDNSYHFLFDPSHYAQRQTHQMALIDKLIKENSLLNIDNLKKDQINFIKNRQVYQGLLDNDDKNEQIRGRQWDIQKSVQKVYFNQSQEEGEISNEFNEYIEHKFQEQFKNMDDLLTVSSEELVEIDQSEYGLILDLRADFLYQNEQYQKHQLEKYKTLAFKVYNNNDFDPSTCSDQTVNDMVSLSIYILNNLHYYQKTNSTLPSLNPQDLLFLLSKFK